jgi:hypothetical protein
VAGTETKLRLPFTGNIYSRFETVRLYLTNSTWQYSVCLPVEILCGIHH